MRDWGPGLRWHFTRNRLKSDAQRLIVVVGEDTYIGEELPLSSGALHLLTFGSFWML